MNKETKTEIFEYTYSSAQQEEIKKIREKYTVSPKEEDKIETLRRLDESVTTKGTVVSLIFGIVGTLIFGTGMCCCLVWDLFALGVIVGLLGIICLAITYPLYTRITKKEHERIAPEILRLTDELMK